VIALAYASRLAPGFSGSPFRLDAEQVLSHFFYLVPLTSHEWLSPVYWTLAYEFVFYLACGLLFGVISSVRNAWSWYALALGLAALSFGPMPARGLLFVMGIAVFRRLALGESVVATLLTIGGTGLAIAVNARVEIAITGMIGAAAILLLAPVRLPTCRLLRAALWLGTVSYSLYLTHVPIGGRVVNLGRRFVDNPVQELLLSLVALAICLVFATVFWRLVERPSVEAASGIGSKSAAARALP
jgi:peptidoglycan/LPS O-acetylase OafA/YrhL